MSRIEHDFLGQREIADNLYYGVQTVRGFENFDITGIPMSHEPSFVKAFGYVKKAAAMANRDLGVLAPDLAAAILEACDRVIAGTMNDQFITDLVQGGAGTSTNMNANEVIANLALETLGREKGDYQYVSPNDHVNYGQSTNDTYPTALRLALIMRLEGYIAALEKLRDAFFDKGKEFSRVLKMGRTHLQDAVPMSLGSEFRGWGTTIGEEIDRTREVQKAAQRDQSWRDRDRNISHGCPWLSAVGGEVPQRSDWHPIHPGERSRRGDLGYWRLCAALRCPEANGEQTDKDMQRYPFAEFRTAMWVE